MTAKLTFNDNFDSLSIWNGSSGVWSTNWWYNDEWGLYSKSNGSTLAGNAEQQWYINANYAPTDAVNPWSTNNGLLTITAKPADSSIQPLISNYKYTSGMINTWHSFSQKYGYFEMRADLPEGQGLWPAFWLLPQDGSWPPELDIMEVLGDDPTRLYTTVHSNATGSHTMKTLGTTVADMSSGYHTYAVDWQQDKITWYFDGKQVFQAATPADMHKPMYMIANLAVGGYWPGSPDASTEFPAEFKIDYIRAYDSNPYVNGGAVASPTAPAATSPLLPPPPPPPAPAAPSGSGVTLTSQAAYSKLTGGSGADTLNAGQGADTLTGGAGADRFVIGKEPWAPIVITDFKVGEDKLDLSALFKASGYAGSDPVKDGYIHIVSDGAGGSLIRFDKDGPAAGQKWPNTIIDIQNVAPSTVTWAKLTGAAGAVTSTAPAPAPTAPAPSAPSDGSSTTGKVLTATTVSSVLTGGADADTITASMGFDTLTGGAGADRFVLVKEPWAPIQIDDFKVGEDKLDLSALFKASGYAGSDPVKDGYIHIVGNGSDGSLVRFDRDGLAAGQKWPNTIIELEHVAPSSITWAKLAGSAAAAPAAPPAPAPAPTEPAATSGQALKAAAPYATLTGGAGADTITASQGGDRLTGGAGADRFVFGSEPWAPIHIADFTPGQDKLDLSALFRKSGYTGKDPITDRYMYVESDGAGGSVLRFDRDARGSSPVWPNTIIDLDHVAPSQVKVADWIIS